MSHSNEQCAADLRDAWQEGYADAIAVLPQVAVILQELIAELRELHCMTHDDPADAVHIGTMMMGPFVWHAFEVTDDEEPI